LSGTIHLKIIRQNWQLLLPPK